MREERQSPARSSPSIVDYDVHGLVGIRLIQPSAADVSAVSAQIGPESSLSREPDLTIRFEEDLRPRGTVSWIQPHEAGFTDEGYFVFTSESGSGPAARLALDEPGRSWDLVCRSGLRGVPLFLPLLDLIMLTKGVLALHASAFTYKGAGVLVAGWARSGKTTGLLAFMAQGADYIGDDRVYLRAGENRLYGLAQPMALRSSHLEELPRYARIVGWRGRSRLRALAALETAGKVAAIGGARDLAGRVAAAAGDASVSVSPDRLFGAAPSLTGTLDKFFLAIAHDSRDVRVERADPERLADQLAVSVRAERLRVRALSLAFRFAFPDERDPLGEPAEAAEREALLGALERSETYALYHPFPAPVDAVRKAMEPIVG